jgi:hypothetical protein
MTAVDVRSERYAEAGSRVKGARIAAHLIETVTTYARDAGHNPTIPQAARAALDELDHHAQFDESWIIWATGAGYPAKVPSDRTKAATRERLASLAAPRVVSGAA